MQIKIRQFEVFDAIARLGSFAAAARALHLTPAALSVAIRELETTLGFRVFERTTRRVALTEAGQQYYPHVERVLHELREAERCALDLLGGKVGTIRIATTQAVISTLLPAAFRAFRQAWPDVQLYPVDVPGNQIPAAIESGLADLAIGVQLPTDERLESQRYFLSRWHCFLGAGHPLAGSEAARWADVAAGPLILIGQTSRLKLQGALPAPLKLQNIFEASTASAALSMAASGQGVAIAPGYLKPTAAIHQLRGLPLTDPELPHELMISIPRKHAAGSFIPRVRDLLLAEVAGVDGGLW
jgi:DNA-binding transcriptional LysR family regulator